MPVVKIKPGNPPTIMAEGVKEKKDNVDFTFYVPEGAVIEIVYGEE